MTSLLAHSVACSKLNVLEGHLEGREIDLTRSFDLFIGILNFIRSFLKKSINEIKLIFLTLGYCAVCSAGTPAHLWKENKELFPGCLC